MIIRYQLEVTSARGEVLAFPEYCATEADARVALRGAGYAGIAGDGWDTDLTHKETVAAITEPLEGGFRVRG